jgi:eukaryotic-like serine/threonine-protein kinase
MPPFVWIDGSQRMSEVEERADETLLSAVTLSVVEGPDKGRQYRYSERTAAIAGRGEDCNVRIDEPGPLPLVSRRHCLFDINPPIIRVRDLGSRNGTYVNGEKIDRGAAGQTPEEAAAASPDLGGCDLVDGDRVTLGSTVLQVHVAAAPPQQVTEPSAPKTCCACGLPVGVDTQATAGPALCDVCRVDLRRAGKAIVRRLKAGDIVLPESGGYSVVEELGRGGQGVVYLARHHRSGELIALKMILAQVEVQPRAEAKFKREIAAVEALAHPNIVSFREAGNIGAVFFFTCEYCSGGSIRDLITREGPLPPQRAVALALQALDGLEHAHTVTLPDGSVGLVHRDIKPANILLHDAGNGPVVKIADFGLAKAFDQAGLSGLTLSGTIEGTMKFVARAQLVDFKYARPEVDVWAMAATLYFMLTGQSPRTFENRADPVNVVLKDDAVPIRERDDKIPEPLAKVIDAALVEEPCITITSAAQLASALREAL